MSSRDTHQVGVNVWDRPRSKKDLHKDSAYYKRRQVCDVLRRHTLVEASQSFCSKLSSAFASSAAASGGASKAALYA